MFAFDNKQARNTGLRACSFPASLKNFKLAKSVAEYRNFPLIASRSARLLLTKAAKDLWEWLMESTVFDPFLSIMTTRHAIGVQIGRSPRTVSRLLNELEIAGFVIREHINRSINIHVRAPELAVDQILRRPRLRPKFEQGDIFVPRKPIIPLLINININNNTAVVVNNEPKPQSEPVVVIEMKNKTESTEPKKSEIVIDRTMDINRFDAHLATLRIEINKKCEEMIKNPSEKWEIYPGLEELYRKESNIKSHLERIKPRIIRLKPNFDHVVGPGKMISDFDSIRLRKSLNNRENSEKLIKEITFSVRRGDLGSGNLPRGISCALKLVRENRWQTPVRFQN